MNIVYVDLQKTDSTIQMWSQLQSNPEIINANAYGKYSIYLKKGVHLLRKEIYFRKVVCRCKEVSLYISSSASPILNPLAPRKVKFIHTRFITVEFKCTNKPSDPVCNNVH